MDEPVAIVGSGLEGLGEERRLQLLVGALTDYALYLLDERGFIRTWNAGAQRFKGYTADEILGDHFSRFYTEEDRAVGLPERALRTAAEEGRFEAEGWRVRKDGTRFWTSIVIDPVRDETGTLIGFAKITRDITHKREAQQALFESEQRFRMLVQGVRDYAIYMLDPDGRVTNWNSGAAAIKGYRADEIIGLHFSVFYTEEDRAAGEPARALETALRWGKYEKEAWRLRRDGSRFWASVLLDAIHDESGRLVGFAKVTRDITEQRRARKEIERSREALFQAQKMEAIGRLTGGVAHDFNNLLTVIRGSAEFLCRPSLSDEKRLRYAHAVAETAERATLLTGQLLAFARRQPLQPELFDVSGRLAGMKQLIGTSIGTPVALEMQVDGDVDAIEVDPNQFETAILNMAINARDAMPSGGRLRIVARNVDHVPAVRGHAAAEGEFVAISIEDSGTGIEPATLSRIFEPFFTTKPVDKGTGLGLSQVYGFAKQSGGEIGVTSRTGAGSTFTLYLPRRRRDEAAGVGHRPLDTDMPQLEPLRVLLVEDNETVGQFAHDLLTELGQTVTRVPHAEAALDVLRRQHDAFDLVFSDIVMPGRSGIELGHEIRRRWPDLPVILTSGYSHVLADEGSHGFRLVQKPYSMNDLVQMLDRVGANDATRSGSAA